MTIADESRLPEQFSELEPFASTWCLATEHERYHKRLELTMAEIQGFYDAAFPRIEEALTYCDKFPLRDLPDDATRLLQLIHSVIMAAMSVEI